MSRRAARILLLVPAVTLAGWSLVQIDARAAPDEAARERTPISVPEGTSEGIAYRADGETIVDWEAATVSFRVRVEPRSASSDSVAYERLRRAGQSLIRRELDRVVREVLARQNVAIDDLMARSVGLVRVYDLFLDAKSSGASFERAARGGYETALDLPFYGRGGMADFFVIAGLDIYSGPQPPTEAGETAPPPETKKMEAKGIVRVPKKALDPSSAEEDDVPGVRFLVAAQTLEGRLLGKTYSDSEGRFTLPLEASAGDARVLLRAHMPERPEVQVSGAGDLDVAAGKLVGFSGAPDASSSGSSPSQGGKNPPAATGNTVPAAGGSDEGFVLDVRSAAGAIVLAATGDLKAPLGDVQGRYRGEIDGLSKSLARTGDLSLSSVGPTETTEAPIDITDVRNIAKGRICDGEFQPFQALAAEGKGEGSVLDRLTRIKNLIAENVSSTNRVGRGQKFSLDPFVGSIPLFMVKTLVDAMTGGTLSEVTLDPISVDELRCLARVIATGGWGNCREKAYLAAYGATQVPEVKQIAVLLLRLSEGSAHALTVACLDGKEAYDITRLQLDTRTANPKLSVPGSEAWRGRCFVVDPWLGPSKFPKEGNTGLLDERYASRWIWQALVRTKPVVLDEPAKPRSQPSAPEGATLRRLPTLERAAEPSAAGEKPEAVKVDCGLECSDVCSSKPPQEY